MILRLDTFLNRLQQVVYLKYDVFCYGTILFVTLYTAEESEKYVILEPFAADEFPAIDAVLDLYKR